MAVLVLLPLAALLATPQGAGAAPHQVPCTPGVYNCPGDGTPPTAKPPPPPATAEAPARGSLSRTGITVTALLLIALLLLVVGRTLVRLSRRHRRGRGGGSATVPRTGVGTRDRPVPGSFAASG